MGKKFRQLTGQGQTVKGALAFYLAPKMAEDMRLKAGELDRVLKSITPTRYEAQINGIVGTIKEQFGSRLAMDENIDDLPELLATLIPAEGEYAMDGKDCGVGKDRAKDGKFGGAEPLKKMIGAKDEDDDSDDDAADGKLGDKFEQNMEKMKAKAKDKKAKDGVPHKLKEEDEAEDEAEDGEKEDMTESAKKWAKKLLGGGRPMDKKLREEEGDGQSADAKEDDKDDSEIDDEDDENEDDEKSNDEEGEEEDAEDSNPKGKDSKMSKDSKKKAPFGKPSMDAAFRSLSALATKNAISDLQARYEAQEAVRPYVGKIDVLACDSVFDIFKMALTANKIDVRGVPESAFPAMVKMLPGKLAMDQKIELAQDGKGDGSFRKEFPNAPTLA
jgi:hypothetical protein